MPARKRAKRTARPKPPVQPQQEEPQVAAVTTAPQKASQEAPVAPTPAAAVTPSITQQQIESQPNVSTTTVEDASAPLPEEQPSVQEESLLAEDDSQESGSGVKKTLLWFVLLVLLAIIVGGIAFFAYQLGLQNGQEQAKKEIVSVTPTEAAAPTETTEEIDKGAYSIQVLNGSGISGEAARARDLLEGEDFVVTDIGNADSDDNEKTIIAKKNDIDDKYLAELKKVLEASYTLGGVLELNEDADDDVIITIGTPRKKE
ncbi:MAG: LytR C-terminal domain-containing protein [Candidatus Levybacteria bacterium]|nr:LytR C-terminal domain-containing protein [Candidatus Levybacteria bacterium]